MVRWIELDRGGEDYAFLPILSEDVAAVVRVMEETPSSERGVYFFGRTATDPLEPTPLRPRYLGRADFSRGRGLELFEEFRKEARFVSAYALVPGGEHLSTTRVAIVDPSKATAISVAKYQELHGGGWRVEFEALAGSPVNALIVGENPAVHGVYRLLQTGVWPPE